MGMRGVALTGWHVHDRGRETLGGTAASVTLAGSADADVAMLGTADAFDPRVPKGIPVGDPIDEAGDPALQQLLDVHGVLREADGGDQSYHSDRGKSTGRGRRDGASAIRAWARAKVAD